MINWDPAEVGLLRAIERTHGRAQLLCVGAREPDAVARALAGDSERPDFEYRRGEVDNRSLERFTAFLRDEIDIARADAVIVLPAHGRGEPDAFSRLTCAAIQRACGDAAVPNIVVAVEDPEAAFEFAGHGVATIFYPGFLRSALMAHACVDLAVFQFLLELVERRHRVQLLPIPGSLADASFGELCGALEEDADGRPLTILGLCRPAPHDDAPRILLNPGPEFPLTRATGLVALSGRDDARLPG